MRTLQPMQWPMPVPLLWWTADYADIRERVRRDGRLDIEEVWLPGSEDGWASFCRRHGDYGFGWDWQEWEGRERARIIAAKRREAERLGEHVRRTQEAWEAGQRERQRVKQAAADREWEQIAAARAHWSRRNAAYASGPYRLTKITGTGVIDGAKLEAGHSYWLPQAIADRLRGAHQ